MKSAEEAPWKARFNRAKLQISGGSRYAKTNATQLSGMSPSPGFIGEQPPSTSDAAPERLAPMKPITPTKRLILETEQTVGIAGAIDEKPRTWYEFENTQKGLRASGPELEPESVGFQGDGDLNFWAGRIHPPFLIRLWSSSQ